MSKKMKLVKTFCKAHQVELEQLINDKSKLVTALKKQLTIKLFHNGISFPEIAEILQVRTQLAQYYYHAPSIRGKDNRILMLKGELMGYRSTVKKCEEWLSINSSHHAEFDSKIRQKIHYTNKLVEAKAKLRNLENNEPVLGKPEPATQWNGYKNGNPI